MLASNNLKNPITNSTYFDVREALAKVASGRFFPHGSISSIKEIKEGFNKFQRYLEQEKIPACINTRQGPKNLETLLSIRTNFGKLSFYFLIESDSIEQKPCATEVKIPSTDHIFDFKSSENESVVSHIEKTFSSLWDYLNSDRRRNNPDYFVSEDKMDESFSFQGENYPVLESNTFRDFKRDLKASCQSGLVPCDVVFYVGGNKCFVNMGDWHDSEECAASKSLAEKHFDDVESDSEVGKPEWAEEEVTGSRLGVKLKKVEESISEANGEPIPLTKNQVRAGRRARYLKDGKFYPCDIISAPDANGMVQIEDEFGVSYSFVGKIYALPKASKKDADNSLSVKESFVEDKQEPLFIKKNEEIFSSFSERVQNIFDSQTFSDEKVKNSALDFFVSHVTNGVRKSPKIPIGMSAPDFRQAKSIASKAYRQVLESFKNPLLNDSISDYDKKRIRNGKTSLILKSGFTAASGESFDKDTEVLVKASFQLKDKSWKYLVNSGTKSFYLTSEELDSPLVLKEGVDLDTYNKELDMNFILESFTNPNQLEDYINDLLVDYQDEQGFGVQVDRDLTLHLRADNGRILDQMEGEVKVDRMIQDFARECGIDLQNDWHGRSGSIWISFETAERTFPHHSGPFNGSVGYYAESLEDEVKEAFETYLSSLTNEDKADYAKSYWTYLSEGEEGEEPSRGSLGTIGAKSVKMALQKLLVEKKNSSPLGSIIEKLKKSNLNYEWDTMGNRLFIGIESMDKLPAPIKKSLQKIGLSPKDVTDEWDDSMHKSDQKSIFFDLSKLSESDNNSDNEEEEIDGLSETSEDDMKDTVSEDHSIFGDVISSYTRADAIGDGTLEDVSDRYPDDTKIYKFPVAFTKELWYVVEKAAKSKTNMSDFSGIIWDICYMTAKAPIQRPNASTNVTVVKIAGKNYKIKAVVGPDDDMSPCVTIGLLDDDYFND